MPRNRAKSIDAPATLASWAWDTLRDRVEKHLTPEQFECVVSVAFTGLAGTESRMRTLAAAKAPYLTNMPEADKATALPALLGAGVNVATGILPNSGLEEFAEIYAREPVAVLRVLAWLHGYTLEATPGSGFAARDELDLVVEAALPHVHVTASNIADMAAAKMPVDKAPNTSTAGKRRQRRRIEVAEFKVALESGPEAKLHRALEKFSSDVKSARRSGRKRGQK